MKEFRFQYQKILDLRNREVDAAKISYGDAMKNVEDAKNKLFKLKEEETLLRNRIFEDVILEPDKLREYHIYLLELKNRQNRQQIIIKDLEKIMFLKHNELVQAHKEEKKWSKLSEVKKDIFIAEELKREQIELDEISLQKFSMKN